MSWWGRHGSERARVLPDFLNVPWSIRDLLVFVAAWFGIQIAVVYAIKGLAPLVPGLAQFVSLAVSGDVNASFVLDLLDAVAGFGVVSLYLHHYNVGWRMVGWRRVSLARAALYLGVIFVLFFVAANLLLALVSALDPSFNANQPQTNDFTSSLGTHRAIALVALVFLPPVLEETIFRGFIFPALAKRTGVIWGAVISSAVFGLAHGQPNLFVYTYPLGLLLCFI